MNLLELFAKLAHMALRPELRLKQRKTVKALFLYAQLDGVTIRAWFISILKSHLGVVF